MGYPATYPVYGAVRICMGHIQPPLLTSNPPRATLMRPTVGWPAPTNMWSKCGG